MNQPFLYGIYTVEFPFLDTSTSKVRPVIVVSKPIGKHGVVAVIPVTSKTNKELVDITITSWREAGLLLPSVARVHRLSTIIQSKLDACLGVLSADDTSKLKEAMGRFLNL